MHARSYVLFHCDMLGAVASSLQCCSHGRIQLLLFATASYILGNFPRYCCKPFTQWSVLSADGDGSGFPGAQQHGAGPTGSSWSLQRLLGAMGPTRNDVKLDVMYAVPAAQVTLKVSDCDTALWAAS